MSFLELAFLVVFWSWVLSAAILLGDTLPTRGKAGPIPPDAQTVRFPSTDGILLSASLLMAGRAAPWTVLCHAFGRSRSDHSELASNLHKAGFNVLFFDFRAHGRSAGQVCSFGHRELNDLYGALSFISQQDDETPRFIGVYGVSMGASVALMAAARDERIRAVVADSPYAHVEALLRSYLRARAGLPAIPFLWFLTTTYRLRFRIPPRRVSPQDIIQAISPRPILIIAGKSDSKTPLEDSRRLADAAGQSARLWIVDSDHRKAAKDYRQGYIDTVLGHFRMACGAR